MVKTDKISSSSPPKSISKIRFTVKKTYEDSKQSLQERLYTLLSRLSDSIEILKTWPEAEVDSTSVHVETTNKLIKSIEDTINAIRIVEEKTNVNLGGDAANGSSERLQGNTGSSSEQDVALADKLRQAAVPMDLLDMMDHADGLNSDCFARGMLREALRQMKNLQRRKSLLKMLASAVEDGIERRKVEKKESMESKEKETNGSTIGKGVEEEVNIKDKKRKRSEIDGGDKDETVEKK